MLPGCLVDDPPPYSAPKQTPPRLDTAHALPLIDQFIFASGRETIPFTMPFSSEDAGELLNAFLLVDYKGDTNQADSTLVPPSTLDDSKRLPVTLHWKVPANAPGCYRLKLRMGHASNLGSAEPAVKTPDIAEANWVASVDADPANGFALVDCPQASQAQPPPPASQGEVQQ